MAFKVYKADDSEPHGKQPEKLLIDNDIARKM
jgi:hypothetical protein